MHREELLKKQGSQVLKENNQNINQLSAVVDNGKPVMLRVSEQTGLLVLCCNKNNFNKLVENCK